MKKYYLILGLVIILLVIGGFLLFNKGAESPNTMREFHQEPENMFAGITLVDFNDLETGTNVFVIGEEDQDKNITATRIIIGGGDDFMIQRRGVMNGDRLPSELPDFNNMREMSEQERGEFMGERMANRGFRERSATTVMIRGNIIGKDDISIILALTEGGSKIVFVSEETDIGELVTE